MHTCLCRTTVHFLLPLMGMLCLAIPCQGGEQLQMVLDEPLNNLEHVRKKFRLVGQFSIHEGMLEARAENAAANATLELPKTYKDLVLQFDALLNEEQKNYLVVIGRLNRDEAGAEGYLFYFLPSGGVFLRKYTRTASGQTEVQDIAEDRSPLVTGVACRVKLAILGGRLQVKVWKHQEPEPAGWLISAEDNTFSKAGTIAFEAQRDTSTYNQYSVRLANLKLWRPQ